MVWIVAWVVVGRIVEVVEGESMIGWRRNFLRKVMMIYFLNRNFLPFII
jgi:hypothetical protein